MGPPSSTPDAGEDAKAGPGAVEWTTWDAHCRAAAQGLANERRFWTERLFFSPKGLWRRRGAAAGAFGRELPAPGEVGGGDAAVLREPGGDRVAHEQRQLRRRDGGLVLDGGPRGAPGRIRRDGQRQRLACGYALARVARDADARLGAVAGHGHANSGDAEQAAPPVDELRELVGEHTFELRARYRHAQNAVVERERVVGIAERQCAARQISAQAAAARPVRERRVGA